MYIVENYALAVLFCIVTMLCWGSWGNTQKLAAKSWRYELFYWDYVIGMVVVALIFAFSMGSIGEAGRSFVPDMLQAKGSNIASALLGGVVFNAANILLSASISLVGLSVAFPIGIGLALVLGVIINYASAPKGDPIMLFVGVALITMAIIVNAIASSKQTQEAAQSRNKGIVMSLVAGVLMSLFFRFVASSMDLSNFQSPEIGKMTPYSAFFVFSIGVLLSNFIFGTIMMKRPVSGEPVKYSQYFAGGAKNHLIGILGGVIWGVGSLFSYIAAEKAGSAISYALGQGATMVAAFWGVVIWREFRGANNFVKMLLVSMFVLFFVGLSLIVVAGM